MKMVAFLTLLMLGWGLVGCGGGSGSSGGGADMTAPAFTSPSTASVAENTTAVLLITTDDPAAVLTLSGTDAALFELVSGELRFKVAPDYENPQDNGHDNVYSVTVTATDAALNSAQQNISVTVTDVAEQTAVLVKKTGQTKSYDQSGNEVTDGSVKDDGYYQKGVDHNYTRDDVKEIVTDHVTGLMWQDDAEAASVTKPWLTLANYNAGDYNNTSGDTAATYCANLTLGGYDDWRLPDETALLGITDKGRASPAIDPVFQNIASSHYWSSTSNVSGPDGAWGVHFYDGFGGRDIKHYVNYVRCVRSGQ